MFETVKPEGRIAEREFFAGSTPSEGILAPALYGDFGWLSLLKALLDQRPYPAFLMQGDLRVRLANTSALRIVQTGRLLVEADGELRLDRPCQDLLAKALRSLGETWAASKVIPFENTAARSILVVNLLSGANSGEGADTASQLFAVSLRSGSIEVSPNAIAEAFTLTRAEASLAAALAEGLTLQDYARRNGLKISTVRWHLQNIFERTETRSQAELVGLLISLFG